MAMVTLMEEYIYLGLPYSSRGLVHYHYDRKHDSAQADLVLEKSLKIYIQIQMQLKEKDTGFGLGF